ncbi:hypothetical protein LZ31DRAFT_547516 [Colletotrichum somersetense]|nr:hypothetical protein LZ31DRAFT_547516 [Colletotrichum somersetense]
MSDRLQTPRQTRASRRNGKFLRQGATGTAPAASSDSTIDSTTDDAEAEDIHPQSPTPRPRRPHATGQIAGTMRQEKDMGSARTLPVRSAPSRYAAEITQQGTDRGEIFRGPSLPPPSDAATVSARSRSPVRAMANLEFAEKPVTVVVPTSHHDIPDDVRSLVARIQRARTDTGLVPASIEDRVAAQIASITPFDMPLAPHNLDTSQTDRSEFDLLVEMAAITGVVRETNKALANERAEAHWNNRIHTPLLVAAIESDRDQDAVEPPGTSFFTATAATITPSCIPQHAQGLDLQAKMVDYCIVVSDAEVVAAARSAVARRSGPANNPVRSVPDGSVDGASTSSYASSVSSSNTNLGRKKIRHSFPQSINHTEYDPLVLRPISVSIETKKLGSSEDMAKAQLSVWVSAQLNRFHQLLGPQPIGITLPLLNVSGSTWQILFAVEKEDRIDLVHFVRVDGTNSVLGCYKIMAIIRALRHWSETTFRTWFLDAVSRG